MRSFALSVLLMVLVAFILLSGATIADAQEVVGLVKDVPAFDSPKTDAGWSVYGWIAGITGAAITASAAFKKFLKRNNVDMDDPKVRSYLILAAQLALIGVAILVLWLAKTLRGKNKEESPNAKLVDSALTELIVLAKWMIAALITVKFAPKIDPVTLASSIGARPEAIQMLVRSSKPKRNAKQRERGSEIENSGSRNPLERFNRRIPTSRARNEQEVQKKSLPEQRRRGHGG